MSSKKINIVLLLSSLLIAFILAEILVRVFIEQETKRLAVYDKDLGWRGRPFGQGIYIRNKDGIRVPFAYNDHGYRDDNLSDLSDSSLRIMLLGDSFVESLEVRFEEVFHKLLENRLSDYLPYDVDVVALSSQGYSTAQELLAFRKYNGMVGADIVLTAFYSGNDFKDNLRKQFAYIDSLGKLQLPQNNPSWFRVQIWSLKRWFYESSHLVFFLKNLLESHSQIRLAPSSKKEEKKSHSYQLMITQKLLTRTRDEIQNAGASYGVVLIPSRAEVAKKEFRKIKEMASFCEEQQISYLDLSNFLDLTDFFHYDGHFNPAGHDSVASAILDFLLTNFKLSERTVVMHARPN